MPGKGAKHPGLRVQMPGSRVQYPEQMASEGANARKRSKAPRAQGTNARKQSAIPRANSKRGYKRQEKRKSIIKGLLHKQRPF